MVTTIKESTHKAKKLFRDNGFEDFREYFMERAYRYIPSHWGREKLRDQLPTFSELKAVLSVLKKEKAWLIKPGDVYVYQFNTQDGDTWTWRMNKVLYDFACKHMEQFFDND